MNIGSRRAVGFTSIAESFSRSRGQIAYKCSNRDSSDCGFLRTTAMGLPNLSSINEVASRHVQQHRDSLLVSFELQRRSIGLQRLANPKVQPIQSN